MNDLMSVSFPDKVRNADRFDLLNGMFAALDRAWKNGIQPLMHDVRRSVVDLKSIKHGTDFFTKADTESEQIILETLNERFGKDTFRIWGEEANAYKGNLDAEITIRIDPILGGAGVAGPVRPLFPADLDHRPGRHAVARQSWRIGARRQRV